MILQVLRFRVIATGTNQIGPTPSLPLSAYGEGREEGHRQAAAPKHERPAQGAGRSVEIWAGQSAPGPIYVRSVRKRVRTNLELDDLGRRSLAGFTMEWCPVAVRRPQTTALPAAIRIVDAAIETFGVEAERIRNAQHDHLAVDECGETVVLICRRNRHVLAEAARVVLIDPGVVARLGAVVADALETRARIFVERPALRAMIAGRLRPVERTLSLGAIEAAEMAAGERNPDYAF